MFRHLPSGLIFEDRKTAKRHFGSSEYNKRLKNREFTLHCQEESNNNTNENN